MTKQIERLRTQAKQLRKSVEKGDPDAARRVTDVLGSKSPLRHADYLHVIAREAGHQSWPKLKFAIEAEQMSRDQRAERLKMALYFGQRGVIERLLSQDPDLPGHNLGLQIATYDASAVKTALAQDADAAKRLIGPRSPILHLAFSQYIHTAPDKAPQMLEIAETLLAHGADVNDGYAAQPGSEHKLSALYGALGHANNLPLARWLLEHGADPDDNESLYHATELGHSDGLALLLDHGASPDGTNALARAMDFDNLDMVTRLLAAGANPNEALGPHPSGEAVLSVPALHQAARRWCSAPVISHVLEHGGDPRGMWHGMTPYATARVFGNAAAAQVLADAGHAHPLEPHHQILADCAEGTPPRARLDRTVLDDELRCLATRIAARPERLEHLKALILAGLDPERPEEMGLTPLHIAGWEGLPDQVAYLLGLSPDLERLNDFGGDALGTIMHGAEFNPNRVTRDHVACARLVLEAGAPFDPKAASETGSEDMAAFLEDWATTRLPDQMD